MTNLEFRAAVFLDRDGTLSEDRGHLRNPSEVNFFANVRTGHGTRHLEELSENEVVVPGIGEAAVWILAHSWTSCSSSDVREAAGRARTRERADREVQGTTHV